MSCACNAPASASGTTLQPSFSYYNEQGQLVTPAGPQVGLSSSWWWLLLLAGGAYLAHRQGWL